MPRSFSGGSRPSANLFRVPTLPEKQLKDGEAEGNIFVADDLDEMQSWVDSMLAGSDDAPNKGGLASPAGSKAVAATPPPALLLSTFDQAMVWGQDRGNAPLAGKPAPPLSGPGVPSGLSMRGNMPAEAFPFGQESIVEIRPTDAMVVNVVTPTAFGYTLPELRGQSLFAITQREDHQPLVHALQVLLRMDEIAKMMTPMGGDATSSSPKLQAIRMIHRVVVGLGQPNRRPELITLDSWATTLPVQGGGSHCLIRSRRASAIDAADGTFRMLPA